MATERYRGRRTGAGAHKNCVKNVYSLALYLVTTFLLVQFYLLVVAYFQRQCIVHIKYIPGKIVKLVNYFNYFRVYLPMCSCMPYLFT